jgi:hypothetical protein
MKTQIQMSERNGEYGLTALSLFCRFVTTQGGQNAANTSDGVLFSNGNR